MHAGTRACAAGLAALALLPAAGCSRAKVDAQPRPAAPARAVAAAAAPTPAARKSLRTLPPGMRRLTVGQRSFLLFVPQHVRRPAPLVVMLGGIGSTSRSEVKQFALTASAKRSRVVVAYPDPVRGLWNAGSCCRGAATDDVAFLTKMRSKIASRVTLDGQRQLLFGYSNGGMMAYAAACHDSHWTGIVVFGASLTARCSPKRAFSITNINGTDDVVAPWDGGWSRYIDIVMPSVWRIDQEFAVAFGCGRATRTTSAGDVIYTYAGCHDGAFIREIRVPGLRHHFPTKKVDGYDMGPVLWRLAGL